MSDKADFEIPKGGLTGKEKEYHGSCHCGHIKFKASLDLSPQNAGRCNCTICTKAGLHTVVTTPPNFTLIAPASLDDISLYQFGVKKMSHYFCPTCGVEVFIKGYIPEVGGDIVSVNIRTLDDVDFKEVTKQPQTYWDGRNDGWEKGAKEEPYSPGAW